MRVLLDENLPVDLALRIHGHSVETVVSRGWAGIQNGELLRRMQGRFDAFLTMDRNLEHQQAIQEQSFGIIVVHAPSNRLAHLEPLVPQILESLADLPAGALRRVGV